MLVTVLQHCRSKKLCAFKVIDVFTSYLLTPAIAYFSSFWKNILQYFCRVLVLLSLVEPFLSYNLTDVVHVLFSIKTIW